MHKHSILVIEDEEDIQQLVSYHLVKAADNRQHPVLRI